ncbi:hypothetical protein pCPXV0133 [Cowpox virus]|uniref:Uncharacterized protein n=1 Tax=Cowpox virus TaxID=10243 RepID=A0A212PN45_COWPX|nr:hypothetical protein pCPXV0133 [Cowpox virus]SNB48284.1 hypothetical protein pCPXV0133 [Cowpox virus]SNB54058.1 hypothetical protein pCPXV0133 [Cowpox virus]
MALSFNQLSLTHFSSLTFLKRLQYILMVSITPLPNRVGSLIIQYFSFTKSNNGRNTSKVNIL